MPRSLDAVAPLNVSAPAAFGWPRAAVRWPPAGSPASPFTWTPVLGVPRDRVDDGQRRLWCVAFCRDRSGARQAIDAQVAGRCRATERFGPGRLRVATSRGALAARRVAGVALHVDAG